MTECDGVRLLSAGAHELLRRVPDALADVFRVGSTAPGAQNPPSVYDIVVAMEGGVDEGRLSAVAYVVLHRPYVDAAGA